MGCVTLEKKVHLMSIYTAMLPYIMQVVHKAQQATKSTDPNNFAH